MSQSKNTMHIFGSIDVLNYTNLNNTRMTGLSAPILGADAANKQYVDGRVVASNLTGGIGITVNTTTNTINSNPNATHITSLGTIQNGSWTANTIQIPYGGTGQTAFTVNKLIYHNSANKLSSIPELTYDSTTFNSSLPFIMSNTTDTTNILSSSGSLIIKGGLNISKRLYVHGDAILNANVTVGNLTINGNLSLNSINSNTSQFSTSTISNLLTSVVNITDSLISNSTNSLNLRSTNNTFTNVLVTSNTVINSLITGILNVPIIGIFGTINSSTISCGNLLGLSSNFLNSTSANINTINLKNTNSTITNIISISSTIQNLLIPTLFNSLNSNLTTLINSNGTLLNITNTNLITSNSTIANIINTNLTSNSAFINSISTGNIQASGTISITNATTSNLISTNLSAANTMFTSASVGNLRVAGISNMITLNLTTITTSNIFVNNLLTSTFNNLNSTTIGALNVTRLSIFSTTNSNSTSTGTLYSNISVNTMSSIGTLNVIGDINTTNLYSNTLVNTPNLLTTNITTSYLRSTGISIQGTVLSTNLSTGTINVSSIINTINLNLTNSTITNAQLTNATATNLRITLSSVGNSYLVNSTTANAFILNANVLNETISNILITKNSIIVANYQGSPSITSGSFFTVLPSTFTNNSTISSGSVSSWYANYISASTLSATNIGVTTNRAANFYVKSNVIVGGNQTIIYNSAMTIGYVSNVTGGNMNTQLSFERSDGNPLSGIYTESSTNKLVFMNGSLSGGGGIGIYTIKDTPVIYSNIPSSTNITPTPYVQLLNTTSTFYSTVNSNSLSTGSLILQGGLAVAKNISANSIITPLLIADNISSGSAVLSGSSTTGNLYVNGNITIVNGSLSQPGYGLFSLGTTTYPVGENNIDFNTTAVFSDSVNIAPHQFTIGSSVVTENVVTFIYPGIYTIHLKLNSNTTTTSPTLLQTNINKYNGNQWDIYQTSSQNTVFDDYTDFHSHFMIMSQANERWKFTFNNGHSNNFIFDNTPQKTQLMINKIG